MRCSSMRRVSSRRASSSDVSLGILFLFAIVLLERYWDPLDVAMDVADQPHDSRHVSMRDHGVHGNSVEHHSRGTQVAESDTPLVDQRTDAADAGFAGVGRSGSPET